MVAQNKVKLKNINYIIHILCLGPNKSRKVSAMFYFLTKTCFERNEMI